MKTIWEAKYNLPKNVICLLILWSFINLTFIFSSSYLLFHPFMHPSTPFYSSIPHHFISPSLHLFNPHLLSPPSPIYSSTHPSPMMVLHMSWYFLYKDDKIVPVLQKFKIWVGRQTKFLKKFLIKILNFLVKKKKHSSTTVA